MQAVVTINYHCIVFFSFHLMARECVMANNASKTDRKCQDVNVILRSNFSISPAKWSRTVLECSKIILEFSRTMF